VSGKVTSYLVICGPLGIGKTTAVVKALAKRQHVIYLTLDKNITSIDAALDKAFKEQFHALRFLFGGPFEFSLWRALARYKSVPDNEKPVLVLDIEQNSPGAALH